MSDLIKAFRTATIGGGLTVSQGVTMAESHS